MAPARLDKMDKRNRDINKWCENAMHRIEEWVLSHLFLCLFILFAFLVALFVVLIMTLAGVSTTESGMMRNFMNGGYV